MSSTRVLDGAQRAAGDASPGDDAVGGELAADPSAARARRRRRTRLLTLALLALLAAAVVASLMLGSKTVPLG